MTIAMALDTAAAGNALLPLRVSGLALEIGGRRLIDGIDPREGREQRGMDVEDAVGEPLDRLGAEDPHEPGQHDG